MWPVIQKNNNNKTKKTKNRKRKRKKKKSKKKKKKKKIERKKNQTFPGSNLRLVTQMTIRPCFQGLPVGLTAPGVKSGIAPGKRLMLPSRFSPKGRSLSPSLSHPPSLPPPPLKKKKSMRTAFKGDRLPSSCKIRQRTRSNSSKRVRYSLA